MNKLLTDYSKYSFWLETCGENLLPRPALPKSIDVDVAILGGGYTGLWTAYYLLRGHPGLKVVVLEKEIVGFGASWRNGGWCSSKFPVTPDFGRITIANSDAAAAAYTDQAIDQGYRAVQEVLAS